MINCYIFLSLIFLLGIFNKIYFFKRKELIFSNYFKTFITFSIIILVVLLFFLKEFNSEIFYNLKKNFFIWLTLYFFCFLSVFLTISVKFFESPTKIIYSIITSEKKIDYDKLLIKLKKKKIIENRIIDLKKQNLIIKKKKILYPTKFGFFFISAFNFLKNFYKIKSEG